MRQARLSLQVLAAVSMLVIAGCSGDSIVDPPPTSSPVSKHSAEVAVEWHKMHMMLVHMRPGFTPMVAARFYGYAGVALYESLIPGMTDRRSLVGQLNELTALPQPESGKEYYWPAVANGAMSQIARDMLQVPTEMIRCIDSLESHYTDSFADSADAAVLLRSIEYGKAVAGAIFEWSRNDGGHEGYNRNFPTTYTPPEGDGLWVPTVRRGGDPQRAMHPTWGMNRPFILTKGSPNTGIDPGAPPAYSADPNSDFYKEGFEVYNTVRNLTPEQLTIAQFWSDDPGLTATPAGHSVSILCQCIEQKGNSLDVAAEAFARMGIAVNDAFIACWEAKYRYNLIRPISFIAQVIDSTWNSPESIPLNTPPFPEYPSGHSVQSGAAAEVLEALYGQNFAFTDHTHDHRTDISLAPRQFASFDAFANEAALSRLYGGIHFRSAIEKGVTMGSKIGAKVNALNFRK